MPRSRGQLVGAVKEPMEAFIAPMKPALVDKPPRAGDWSGEIKFDGYWSESLISSGVAVIRSSSGSDWTARFGKHLAAALRDLPAQTAIIQGEVVAEDERGIPDFGKLQTLLGGAGGHGRGRGGARAPGGPLRLWAFDLLYLEGWDLRRVRLADRRQALAELLAGAPPNLAFSETLQSEPEDLLARACEMGLEGVVLKRQDGFYREGPSRSWLKMTCKIRESFVLGGWIPAAGPGDRIGSVLLGQYDDAGRLRYMGKVGAGIDAAAAAQLARRLGKLGTASSPFRAGTMSPATLAAVRFVRPAAVAEVQVRGWTSAGKVRHGSFKALRDDREPRSITWSKRAAGG